MAKALVEDPIYRLRLQTRLKSGKIAPAVETMLWFYAYGKPKETVEHSGPDGRPISIDKIERVIVRPVP